MRFLDKMCYLVFGLLHSLTFLRLIFLHVICGVPASCVGFVGECVGGGEWNKANVWGEIHALYSSN